MDKKILITGAAGFIGWKVCGLLLQQGYRVTAVDNMNDAYDTKLKEWRLEQLRKEDNFEFFEIDITNRMGLHTIFVKERKRTFEAVINFAARAGVRQSINNPWIYYETNVIGNLNLLEVCRTYGIKKYVLASTSSVYGRGKFPFREDQNTEHPVSPYAASKEAAEIMCYTYHYLYNIDISILRYFTVYGPAGRPDMSIFRFIKWIAEKEPVVLYGDGSQARDFTFVEDIAIGTILALKPLGFEIINLGSSKPISLKTVISKLKELFCESVELNYQPLQPTDISSTWADISKAKKLLGWDCKTTIDKGLKMAVDWYKENRSWVKTVDLSDNT